MANIYPVLEPWVDTRSYNGRTAATGVTWRGGVWPGWMHALRNGYALSANPPWGSGTSWGYGSSNLGPRAPSTGTLTDYPTDQGLIVSGSYHYLSAAIYGTRPLARAPIAVDSVQGGVQVSLGGKTYRTTYGQRRLWQLDLLLNGPLDVLYNSYYADMRTRWPLFLRLAEKGCTCYMDRASWTQSGTLSGTAGPYYGSPYRICGQLVDATNVRWSTNNGRQARWEVLITIAEQEPPGYTGG